MEGVERLDGVRMPVMPDRVEALTWIVYAVIAGGDLWIEPVPFAAMEIPLIQLEKAGVDLFRSSSGVYVRPDCLRGGAVQPFELACGTHPGVISDMQPFFVLLGLMADGRSRVFDYRYPERIEYVAELARFCADGSIDARPGSYHHQGWKAVQAGPRPFDRSARVDVAGDGRSLRPGDLQGRPGRLALRGYNDLEAKLASIGAPIEVVDD